jgi:hypothetical protein
VDRTLAVGEDKYEYIESNGTVRYQSRATGGDTSAVDYAPFEEWAVGQANLKAKIVLHPILEVSSDGRSLLIVDSAMSRSPPEIVILHQTLLDESGEVKQSPPISAMETVERLPETIAVTVVLDGHEETIRHHIYVKKNMLEPSEY